MDGQPTNLEAVFVFDKTEGFVNSSVINMNNVALITAVLTEYNERPGINITTIHGKQMFVETYTLKSAEEWCRSLAVVSVSKS